MSARPEDVIAEALHMPRYWPDDVRFKRPSAILAALRTAGFVIEQDWQPIETAPRDGTQVLLIARYPTNVAWSDQYHSWWYTRAVTEDVHWARWPHSFLPTHWRPLPAPPEGQP
jgi:hypothetical protein